MSACFSVIIPVYNAEKTLRRCVESLLFQLREADEIILINDGSQDGSGAVCAEYAQKSSRIVYLEQPNGGVSSARNTGLDAARGRYVLFVDSDDCVPPALFRTLEQELSDRDWDLIRFSYRVDDGKGPYEVVSVSASYDTRAKAFPRLIDDICSKHLNPPWAKVYRREILQCEQIRFPLGASVAEDRAFNIRYSMFVNSYRVSPFVAYCVNTENEQSLSRKRRTDLEKQFRITGAYVQDAIRQAAIPESEKELYDRAYQFGVCRGIYKDAKDLRRDRLSWLQRQKDLWHMCGALNHKHLKYPSTFYCRKIVLPVRLRQTWLIDLIAKHLMQYQ